MTTDPDPFEEGQQAARKNIPAGGNPYRDGSAEHSLWRPATRRSPARPRPTRPKAIEAPKRFRAIACTGLEGRYRFALKETRSINYLADLLQAFFEAWSIVGIEFRGASHLRDLLGIQRADHPRRRTDDQRIFGEIACLP